MRRLTTLGACLGLSLLPSIAIGTPAPAAVGPLQGTWEFKVVRTTYSDDGKNPVKSNFSFTTEVKDNGTKDEPGSITIYGDTPGFSAQHMYGLRVGNKFCAYQDDAGVLMLDGVAVIPQGSSKAIGLRGRVHGRISKVLQDVRFTAKRAD